ncbi:polyprenyl synthetase family protein, partial [Cobetia sp. SIMBA_158]|uniref:polyprenyl synthetase family protein n=1 Tax=Cobetia sp. SIMBA_158 TaxID=3081617 RepID=UPI00397F1833
VEVGSIDVMAIPSAATCTIAEGEVLQLPNIGNADIDEAAYFETLHGKTDMLFETAAHAGAILARETDETVTPAQVSALQ